jgi:hypothetical protein
MWGGFAIFWEVQVLLHGAPVFFALWGIPFVLVGLYLIAGRFFVDRARRAHTYYGLTSRRALVVRRQTVTSTDLAAEASFEMRETSHGRGTITWGLEQGRGEFYAPKWANSQTSRPSFDEIEDARVVYGKLLEAQRASREPVANRPRVAPLTRVEAPSGDEPSESAGDQKRATRS